MAEHSPDCECSLCYVKRRGGHPVRDFVLSLSAAVVILAISAWLGVAR